MVGDSFMSTTNDIPFKKELLLDIDMFQKPAVREDMTALAQVIQNLIIIEKGTYPNQPELGVGISNYLFEIGDSVTIESLSVEIEDQIEKFINPVDFDIQIDIKLIESKDKKYNTLAIGIIVKRVSINSVTDEVDEEYSYAQLLFGGNTSNKKIVSKILV